MKGPRWPRYKILTLGPEGSRFERPPASMMPAHVFSCHLKAVQNFEVCSKIFLLLLQSPAVVRSRLWGRRVPGSKPDSTEDPPCIGPVAR
ncbi:hypothetical protein AVEN_174070-1 [Araneus ventricosus]|uniref:Uncharacterized protein n=1 Tax=Araneus ventricosus TaxID=182803 RepID=A0A4Y2C2D0_ARAVE|nr:hypothetical protein AVEN_174070-1 [Araneus ventricosus]